MDRLRTRSLAPDQYGRRLMAESEFVGGRWDRPECARRREVLAETLEVLGDPDARDRFRKTADRNVARWRSQVSDLPSPPEFSVERGDWGDVALAYSRRYGEVFAVLNMANAYVPGGAYVEGAPAQEENMFRRTDCHFSIPRESLDEMERYPVIASELLNANHGRVYLDVADRRVCLRGPEDRALLNLGYSWLDEDLIFPFYELRSAARDYRDGSAFDETDAVRRIAAQLDTLEDAGVRHVVLSAFGCGAFRNPAEAIAHVYRTALDARRKSFDCVVFAIHHPGYGPDNLGPFSEEFLRAKDELGG